MERGENEMWMAHEFECRRCTGLYRRQAYIQLLPGLTWFASILSGLARLRLICQ